MKNKILALTISLFLCSVSLYAKKSNGNTTKNSFHKTIKMCVDPNWMPFEKIDKNGKYIGIISDYAKIISTYADLKFELVKTVNFKESLDYLKRGKCDIIMSNVATPKLKREFLYTKPYLTVPRAYATNNKTPWVNDFSQLLNSKLDIGVVKNFPTEDILKKLYKHIRIKRFDTQYDALKALSSEKIIAFVNIMPSLAYDIQRYMFTNIKIAGYLKSSVKLSILINKKLKFLPQKLNSAIDKIDEKDRINILNRWLKVKLEDNKSNKFILKITLSIFLVTILLTFIIFYIIKKLKAAIEKGKEQELLMLRQSRFVQMGEMISLIAHQWRQPLNNLSILSQLIATKYSRGKLDDKLMNYFKENSAKQIEIMTKTIDNFKNFFKTDVEEQIFFLNDIVKECIAILEPSFNQHYIGVNFSEENRYKIKGYPSLLLQAIINILNNAKDALIETETNNKQIAINIYKESDYVILHISDNAGGIPDKIIKNIFEPYVSTKGEKGTGLGLYMTKIIIEKRMNSTVKVFNKNGGANFIIKFKGE